MCLSPAVTAVSFRCRLFKRSAAVNLLLKVDLPQLPRRSEHSESQQQGAGQPAPLRGLRTDKMETALPVVALPSSVSAPTAVMFHYAEK